MKINMAQLNQSISGTIGDETIQLTTDQGTQAIDFQQVLASLFGLSFGEIAQSASVANGVGFESASRATDQDNLISEQETDSGLLSDLQIPAALPFSIEAYRAIEWIRTEPASELSIPSSTKAMEKLLSDFPVPEGITGQPVTDQEVKQWIMGGLKQEVADLVSLFQDDMQISRVEESASPETVAYTATSYRNLQRLQIVSPQEPDPMDTQEVSQPIQGVRTDAEEPAAKQLPVEESVLTMKGMVDKDSVPKNETESDRVDKTVDQRAETMPKDSPVRVNSLDPKGSETIAPVKVISNDRELREKMVESIRESQIAGVSKVKVQLHPKELGHVEIELKVRQGQMEGEIKVMSQEVKEQVEQIITPIREMLRNEQMTVKEFNITLMQSGAEQNDGQPGHQMYHEQENTEPRVYGGNPEPDPVMTTESGINLLA